MPLAPIVLRQPGRALAGHGSGQETGSHGGINDHTDSFMQAVRQDVLFDFTVYQRVRWLQRGYGSDGLRAFYLWDAEIGDSDPSHLAFVLQGGERGPAFFERG